VLWLLVLFTASVEVETFFLEPAAVELGPAGPAAAAGAVAGLETTVDPAEARI
jgi:hypothetical protein